MSLTRLGSNHGDDDWSRRDDISLLGAGSVSRVASSHANRRIHGRASGEDFHGRMTCARTRELQELHWRNPGTPKRVEWVHQTTLEWPEKDLPHNPRTLLLLPMAGI